MSNWSVNRLTIQGDLEELQRFIKANSTPENKGPWSTALNFNKLLPMPYNTLDIVSWQEQTWGTQEARALQPTWNIVDNTAVLLFETSNEPPHKWLRKAIQTNPKLSFDLAYYSPLDDIGKHLYSYEGEMYDSASYYDGEEFLDA